MAACCIKLIIPLMGLSGLIEGNSLVSTSVVHPCMMKHPSDSDSGDVSNCWSSEKYLTELVGGWLVGWLVGKRVSE